MHATLSGPESLGKLTKLREEYERQLAGTEVQLSLVAGRQAEEAKAILKLVDRCKQGMDEVEGMRSGLSAKLEEAVTAVPNYSLLRKVFVTRRNLGKTLVDLDSIVAVPTEMKRIEELLDMDDGGNLDAKDHTLPDVHKSLMQLERRSFFSSSLPPSHPFLLLLNSRPESGAARAEIIHSYHNPLRFLSSHGVSAF